MSSESPSGSRSMDMATSGRWAVALILLVWGTFWLLRLTGPADLADENHQERQAAYVLDILHNGHWVCQANQNGILCGKPPLYTWLSAAVALPFGRLNMFALYLPGALAVLGICLLLWYWGKRQFGAWAGLFAALLFLVSPTGAKMVHLARTDSLFACTIGLAAFLGYLAWTRGHGWTWFWLAAAAATMTKGPHGLLFAAGGLLVWFWERRDPDRPAFRGNHFPGILLFLLITAGWFFLAWLQLRHAVTDRMVTGEMVDAANWGRRGFLPIKTFYKPAVYLLTRFLPWSLLLVLALWRVIRQPAEAAEERRAERYVACYFFGILAILSLAPHQRPDLMFPLLVPAALLAGRELARLVRPERFPRLVPALAAGWIAMLIPLWYYYHVIDVRDKVSVRTRGIRRLAEQVQQTLGPNARIVCTEDAPVTFQFYLGTYNPHVPLSEAVRQLGGTDAVVVAVGNLEKLRTQLPPGTTCRVLCDWPETGPVALALVTNR